MKLIIYVKIFAMIEKNKWTINDTISYDNDVITSLLESSAESSIYTEGGMDF